MAWPIETEDLEDLTFTYTLGELGISAGSAANHADIKRLRPLVQNQPWGIFFVEFEPKRLPVVALRRILSAFVTRNRASANSADRMTWETDDLLFISSYGDDEQRQLSFAHFSPNAEGRSLPTLKVLGWDNRDTALHLDAVAGTLTSRLAWPSDDTDAERWRQVWRSAFTLRNREVISTSRDLSIRLAELARAIRDRINTALAIETDEGPLTKLMQAFRSALVHDMAVDDFADMYAQTIAYGLLSARIADPRSKTTDDFAAHMRTNPLLRELMTTFFQDSGTRGLDFDELGVNEVVGLLDEANMEEVLRDFGDRNPREDPVIHFYESFLREYDPKEKLTRGVFYTPRPVVSRIVRSVDALLRDSFQLADGLADTTTWGEMASRGTIPVVPETVSPDEPFVQVLDPATGTGTFLVEIIEVIHETMIAKWRAQGYDDAAVDELWNAYVPQHLLPRLYAYELLMAPYAIAHLKVGLKLHETGYRFEKDERARVYLTNALEPAKDFEGQFDFAIPALAQEAHEVSRVKLEKRFTVIVGNPPYANYGMTNKIPFIFGLLDDYKRGLSEKKLNLDDDFIKFIRLSQYLLERSGHGVHGMITNNTFLEGLTHRVMRQRLMDSFVSIEVANLHGSSKKKESAPDGSKDENVFDITVGVAISLFVKRDHLNTRHVELTDLWGRREDKYEALLGNRSALSWVELEPAEPNYFFAHKDFRLALEYESGVSLREAFGVWQNGLKTDRDDLFFDFDKEELEERMQAFFRDEIDPEFAERYRIENSSSYDIETRRQACRYEPTAIRLCLYRPMDFRWLYYDPGLTSRPAKKVMQHMTGANLGLIATRQTQEQWDVLVTRMLCGHKSCAAYDINSLFPLFLEGEEGSPTLSLATARSNLTKTLTSRLKEACGRSVESADAFSYIYAVLNSPAYRRRYEEFLRIDFPRLPIPRSAQLFSRLKALGEQLVAVHTLESPALSESIADYEGPTGVVVASADWDQDSVWLDGRARHARFTGVAEDVWTFRFGGFQVCERWLKDRRGHELGQDDVAHYRRIVAAIVATIRLRSEIDEAIDENGGWPDAFGSGIASVG